MSGRAWQDQPRPHPIGLTHPRAPPIHQTCRIRDILSSVPRSLASVSIHLLSVLDLAAAWRCRLSLVKDEQAASCPKQSSFLDWLHKEYRKFSTYTTYEYRWDPHTKWIQLKHVYHRILITD